MTTTIDLYSRHANDTESTHIGTVDLDDLFDATRRWGSDTGAVAVGQFTTDGFEIIWEHE